MISIIVPIYNTGKYLKKCLDSIKNQTFKDFEVILVDDGSTDNSAEICREFSETDSRFKYFYKENGGTSSARNLGLENAKGEYIAFIDSDDYIEPDYFETLAEHCSGGYDIIQCGMTLVRNGNNTELVPDKGEYDGKGYAELIIKRRLQIFLFQTPTTKLYKRERIISNSLNFDEEVTVSEDCLFNTQFMKFVKSVLFISYSGYNYLQDNSTVSKSKNSYKKAKQSIKVGNITSGIRFDTIERYGLGDNPEIIKGFQTAICIIYISNAHMIETGEITKNEKKKLYEEYF